MPKARHRARTTATRSSLAIAIMAAGKGTRMKSQHPKVLHAAGGRALLEHVIAAAEQLAPAHDVYAIIGHDAGRVREAVAHTGVNFILQAEQRGTGHALMVAELRLKPYRDVLVLSGDVPLIRPDTLRRLLDFHRARKADMTILTAEPPDPASYGRILRRGKELVAAIVEQKSLRPAERHIREINSGIYLFGVKSLFANIRKLTTNNPHGEYYLTDMASLLVKGKKKVVALSAGDHSEVLGVNTRADLASLDARLRDGKAAALMASGVTMVRPETSLIDADAVIGADTIIQPSVQVLGKTRIGRDCRIGSFSVIRDCQIADGAEVRPGCVLTESTVHKGAVLGPYAHLRPGSEIGEGAHVGNFVETKKARLGKGSKANHLSYLGDAVVGAGVNVGAGTITCNYDGVQKHATIIEDGAFIGSDSTLVAPVRVGRGAYVGAGSCITDDVPADALALGRSRQVNKEGWARQRRASSKKKL